MLLVVQLVEPVAILVVQTLGVVVGQKSIEVSHLLLAVHSAPVGAIIAWALGVKIMKTKKHENIKVIKEIFFIFIF
ncbi:hypothetical protein COT97_02190 [Candidatus Falkowbacteria bacterium CG10_big_fil_rev_8_21_14_0_10_39_11]|uniref:Uncharacterized protein n=1 Tax=Candidatus Falkowbacteria bacterium CG10_big_fil_rev_8_21_14_0_10_39_11 TaxID=1974565 RepID=A0A2H0V794_9BACT|nr:MAG: hypothetical protein COT97_02190 [Candidatus Falkowbacteria bacterium CG10_big_fil_rev_8_21_14_0_10_39_11]